MRRILVLVFGLVLFCAAGATMPAAAADPILIGIPTSLTIPEGKESLNAVKMAVEEINADGGVKVGDTKRLIQIEAMDLRDSSPDVTVADAVRGLEELITAKKVHAIVVGPFRSQVLLDGMDVIAKHKVPMLTTLAMTPESETKIKKEPDKYKYCFRVCMNAQQFIGCLARALVRLGKRLGFRKLFVMHQKEPWAEATARYTSLVISRRPGYSVVGSAAYPAGSSDFAPGLTEAKSKGAQVIMSVLQMSQSGILLKQWRDMKIPALVLSGSISPMVGPDAWKTFEGKIGGLLNLSFEVGSGIAPAKYAPAKEFYDKYQKKYGVPMEAGRGPASSYDAVYVLAEAVERAGSVEADKIVTELEKADRKGVIGRIKFDQGHQVIFGDDPNRNAAACVAQWTEAGKRVIVFPASLVEGKIQLPSWMKGK